VLTRVAPGTIVAVTNLREGAVRNASTAEVLSDDQLQTSNPIVPTT
jgi:hypothetical protein